MTFEDLGFRTIAHGLLVVVLSSVALSVPNTHASQSRTDIQTTSGFWNAGFGVARGCSWLVNATASDSEGRLYLGLSGLGQTCGDAAGPLIRFDPEDESFTSLGDFSPPGGLTSSGISSLVSHNNAIYVGGLFAEVDGLTADGLARFDTVTEEWSSFGAGVTAESGSGSIWAVVVTDEKIWVGGRFDQAGDVETTGIARFDRTSGEWEAPGGGLESSLVQALALSPDDTLYAGGQFRDADGEITFGLKAWNGSDWSPIPESPDSGTVGALTFIDDTLYVGGNFTIEIDETDYRGIASWDGSKWSGLGENGLNPTAPFVLQPIVGSLATHGGNLYVGGSFERADGQDVRHVAQWNPTTETWSALGTDQAIGLRRGPASLALNRVAVSLAIHDGALYVGGTFVQAGDQPVNNLARFDLATQTWQPIGSDSGQGLNAQDAGRLAVHEGEVLTSGVLSQGGLTRLNSTGRWNPVTETWSAFGNPNGPALLFLTGRLVAAGGRVFASGSSFVSPDIDAIEGFQIFGTGGLVQWDESEQSWSPVDAVGRDLTSILALVGSGELLYAGGGISGGGGAVRVWDTATSSWSSVGSNTDGLVRDLAVADNGSVYAVGSFENAGDTAAAGIARWSPATGDWEGLGQGLSNSDGSPPQFNVVGIAPDGDVYVGGRFDTAGDQSVSNIARWDGVQWHALGEGITSSVPELTPAVVAALAIAENGDVFAGGLFDQAGGQRARNLARWDGAQWSVVGDEHSDGVTQGSGWHVRGLALIGDELFVSGSFSMAGDQPSAHFAQFTRDLGGADVEIDIDVEEFDEPAGGAEGFVLMARSLGSGLLYTVDVRNRGQNTARNVDFRISADPVPDQVQWTCQPLLGNAVCPEPSGTGLPELVFNLPGLSGLRFEIRASVVEGTEVYEQTLEASSLFEPVFLGDVPVSQSTRSTLVNDNIFRERFEDQSR